MRYMKKQGFRGEKITVLPMAFLSEARQHPLVQPLYFTDIGYFPEANSHWIERPEGSAQYVLIVCLKGQGFLDVGGRHKDIQSGEFICIPQGLAHTYGAKPTDPWSILWVHFLGTNAAQYGQRMPLPECMQLPQQKLLRVRSLFDEMFTCLERGYTLDGMIHLSQVLSHLLSTLFFLHQDVGDGMKRNRMMMENSILHMKENIGTRLTLPMLARQANLSTAQYSHLFKEMMGVAPIEYFNRIRIQQACLYLDTTDLKIKEIAQKLGFQDPYYFSRAFHRIMQQSPFGYRNVPKG